VKVIYRFGPLEFDPAAGELRRAGETLEAQPKVLAALEVFLAAPGRLLTRDELLDRLWPGLHVGEEALTQTIRKLRLLLGDDAEAPRYLQTAVKRGYRFIAPVERIEVAEPKPSQVSEASSAPPLPNSDAPARSRRRRTALAAVALGVGLAALLMVAFREREPAGSARLWAAEPRRLTSSPRLEIQPAISPDGELVAFSAASDEAAAPGELDLWVMAVAGGDALRLTATPLDEWGARFRRDGREILFLRGAPGDYDAELRAIPSFGGVERRLATAAGSADWSADGAEIALARHAGEEYEIVRRRLADGAERRIASTAEPPHALVWSPDGGKLAYLAGRRHWVVDAEGGEPGAVAPGATADRGLAWLGDRALLSTASWSGLDRRLARLPLDGAPEALLRRVAGATEPSIAAAGDTLVFVSESKQREIWRLAPDGTTATTLAAPSTVEGFDVDAAGSALVLLDWDPTPGRTPLVGQRLGAAGSENLGEGLCPALSPDGARLATLDPRPEARGLYLVDLATGARRRLVGDAGPAGAIEENLHRCPSFSPDGRQLAVELLAEDGSAALAVVDLESGAARAIATGRHGRAAWSPDGGRLAYCSNADGSDRKVRTYDLATQRESPLPIDCPFRAGPVWDRDGVLWVLVDQKTRPTLVGYRAGARELHRLPLALPIDPSFWGVFEVRRTADGAWWVLVERYTSDLFLLAER